MESLYKELETTHTLISLISCSLQSAKLQDAETALSLVRRDMTLMGENEIPALVKDSAALNVTEVLRGDYNLKISRQEYFSCNQDKVCISFSFSFLRFHSLFCINNRITSNWFSLLDKHSQGITSCIHQVEEINDNGIVTRKTT